MLGRSESRSSRRPVGDLFEMNAKSVRIVPAPLDQRAIRRHTAELPASFHRKGCAVEASEAKTVELLNEDRIPFRSSIVELRGSETSAVRHGKRAGGEDAVPVAHDVYTDLARILAVADDDVESAEAAYLCAAAAAWAPAGSLTLIEVLQRLGLGSRGRCDTLSVRNAALDLDAEVHLICDPHDTLGLVVFRGPELSVGGLQRDVRQTLQPMPDGRGFVHGGCLRLLLPLWDGLLRELERSDVAERRLYFTGYGMGGALAMLAAARLVAQGVLSASSSHRPRLQGVHTFGQPRVGDDAFATWVEERIGERLYRYVLPGDPLTRSPSPLSGLHHAGRECRLESGRWRMLRAVPSGNLTALWKLGQHSLESIVRRITPTVKYSMQGPCNGVEPYLRMSRNAVNRAIHFP